MLKKTALSVERGIAYKGWLAIAKQKTLSLFISLSKYCQKLPYALKTEKLKVKVVLAWQWLASPFE